VPQPKRSPQTVVLGTNREGLDVAFNLHVGLFISTRPTRLCDLCRQANRQSPDGRGTRAGTI